MTPTTPAAMKTGTWSRLMVRAASPAGSNGLSGASLAQPVNMKTASPRAPVTARRRRGERGEEVMRGSRWSALVAKVALGVPCTARRERSGSRHGQGAGDDVDAIAALGPIREGAGLGHGHGQELGLARADEVGAEDGRGRGGRRRLALGSLGL